MKKHNGKVGATFQLSEEAWEKVRALAARRRGTERARTAQDIYAEAVEQYLQRHAAELELKRTEGE